MSEVNCFFERVPNIHDHHCQTTSDCFRCVWNRSNGENERRKRNIRNFGLTQRKDGLFGLVIRR